VAEQRFPLANDIDGNPLDAPEAAVAWRMGRRAGRGRPQLVFDPSSGPQPEFELDATVDTLRPGGPGGDRLADELAVTSTALRTRRARIKTRMRSQAVKEGAR
jgi:hypothetical protein